MPNRFDNNDQPSFRADEQATARIPVRNTGKARR